MKIGESFWWNYYGSGKVGDRRPPRRKFKYNNLVLIIVAFLYSVVTLWVVFK